MIRLLLADDHQILLDGIRAILEDDPELNVIGTASNGLEVLSFLEHDKVDVLLLDLQMPKMDGMETIEQVNKLYPEIKILMLTTTDEGSIITSIFKKGAIGYLLKNSSQEVLIQGIKNAYAGEKVLSPHLTTKMIESLSQKHVTPAGGIPPVTNRELDVLRLISKEYTTQQIADELFVSTNTVATHKRNLFVKMDVKNSVGMIRKAVDWGIL